MQWMEETQARRSNPRVLWSDVRSIVMLGMNYGPDVDPRDVLAQKDKGAISVYARHRDYHDLIKGRLKELAAFLLKQAGDGDVKVFVDTAPVMEKPLAQAAGRCVPLHAGAERSVAATKSFVAQLVAGSLGVGQYAQSTGFVTGSSGWRIRIEKRRSMRRN